MLSHGAREEPQGRRVEPRGRVEEPQGAHKLSPGPAPAPPALSPKDTRDSAQYRASNHALGPAGLA